MKNILPNKLFVLLFTLSITLLLVSCGQANAPGKSNTSLTSENLIESNADTDTGNSTDEKTDDATLQSGLTVRFGDSGIPFTMHLYDNETANAIARHVGTAAWRLPIYNYDDFDNWEVMQYYDIPSRYEIPSTPETVTQEKTGEVYYSAPNRIVLFYGDTEVSGEYTRIGYFDATNEFITAVKDNPVLEGWNNKIINISPLE